jgi:hypothetical protein
LKDHNQLPLPVGVAIKEHAAFLLFINQPHIHLHAPRKKSTAKSVSVALQYLLDTLLRTPIDSHTAESISWFAFLFCLFSGYSQPTGLRGSASFPALASPLGFMTL